METIDFSYEDHAKHKNTHGQMRNFSVTPDVPNGTMRYKGLLNVCPVSLFVTLLFWTYFHKPRSR